MTLQQLKYIVTVAETGNITEAAKRLFISQPSLTNAIRELEKEMQITIFHRTNKGVTISNEGDVFLSYARQVLEQADLLEEKFLNKREGSPKFSVSCQHYSFAVNAFVDLIREFGGNKYDFTLRETQTHEIIEDVSRVKSEIGILYTSSKNEEVIMKLIRQHELKFEELFVAKPHVFICSEHPLAEKDTLTLEDLEEYPYLSFEQGEYNSFYFSEEILSTLDRKRNIKVRDRATLFNLVIGLNGYTVSSGVISKELNGESIIAKPLLVDEYMRIGVITQENMELSRYGKAYMEALKRHMLYEDIKNMNQIKHYFSLVAIKDEYHEFPNRFLLYYDQAWKCWFFPNYKTKESNNEEFVAAKLSNALHIKEQNISLTYVTEKVQPKFSRRDQIQKVYSHRLYQGKISDFPKEIQSETFMVDQVKYRWMTIAEMEADNVIREVNSDVVSLVKESIQ